MNRYDIIDEYNVDFDYEYLNDVINHTFEEERELGDIFVSIPKMKAQAEEYGHSEKRELSFLVCHGLLHLLGYDHTRSEEEEKLQFGLQDEILNDLGITR